MSDVALTGIGIVLLTWLLAAPLVGGYVGALFALRTCERNIDCPRARVDKAAAWTSELEALRAKGKATT
jgi:hypothetical protein